MIDANETFPLVLAVRDDRRALSGKLTDTCEPSREPNLAVDIKSASWRASNTHLGEGAKPFSGYEMDDATARSVPTGHFEIDLKSKHNSSLLRLRKAIEVLERVSI